jgi:hypothetical protein
MSPGEDTRQRDLPLDVFKFVSLPRPFSSTLRLINAHIERHLAQIEEVKATAGFPKL